MIYLLYGQDDFRIRARVGQIYRVLVDQHPSLPLVGLDQNKLELEDVQMLLSTQSLLSNRRLVVLRDILASKIDRLSSWLASWLKQNNPGEVDLIFWETATLPSRSPWREYLSVWQVEAYPLLSVLETKAWLNQELTARGLQIAPIAQRQLLSSFGNDLWRLDNELDKLAMFAPNQVIGPAILEQLIVPSLPDNIFQAVEALASKNLAVANNLLNRQLAVGTPEGDLLTLVAYQFRVIALLKALTEAGVSIAQLAARAGLHPYVVKKNLSFTKTFSWWQLQRVFYLLQKIDTAIKLGQTQPRVGLDILAAQIVSA